MASKFARADKDTENLTRDLIAEFHGDLHAQDIKVDLIMAFGARNDAGEKTGPALKHHGYIAGAIASLVSLKSRVMGRGDCEILIDGDSWTSMTPGQQKALLDHELSHFSLARDVDGGVIFDTSGRPKMKMRMHDVQTGWFTHIAKRYGEDSAEVTQAMQIFEEAGQAYFPFLRALKPKTPKRAALKG